MPRNPLNTLLCLGVLLSLFHPASAADAPKKRDITLDDLAKLQRVGGPTISPDGEWIQVNAAFCRLLGYDADELLTLNLADLTVPGDKTVQVDEAEEMRNETRYFQCV